MDGSDATGKTTVSKASAGLKPAGLEDSMEGVCGETPQTGKGRSFELGENSGAGVAKKQKLSEGDNAPTPHASKPDVGGEDAEAFTCGICQEIFYDCVTVAPCQHNFCNSCFSMWHNTAKKKGLPVTCPACRVDVFSVARNSTLRYLVEAYLKVHPEQQRTDEDKQYLEKEGIVGATPLVIKNRRGSHDEDSEYEEDYVSGDEDDEDGYNYVARCPQCPLPIGQDPNPAGGFTCPLAGMVHLTCMDCMQPMPARPECVDLQKCSICLRWHCDTYWRSQTNLRGGQRGCPSANPAKLQKLVDLELTALPALTFGGNVVEQDLTTGFMQAKNLSLKEVVASCVQKLNSGEFELPKIGLMTPRGGRSHLPYPFVPPTPVTSSSTVCNLCADVVVADLLYLYRRSISKEDLEDKREDCWYGRECRTQFHNVEHGRRLNHICELNRNRSNR
eukprot:TRINITY_DN4746_c1_g4_i1.p1 TRINITY_DN4746_c1_g4~~TRINITY_DN4746_c1_g4_i1.p1  ORF type:complete len:446 (+),score=56.53 TRINITY_DN4746_c1_g4_i1:96-1433(+)